MRRPRLGRAEPSPLQAVDYSVPVSYSFALTFAPNGDVLAANDSVNGNWTYQYDDFNRLVNATQSGQPAYTYAYDRYGNRWQHTYNGSCLSGTSSCIALAANNHVATGGPLSYDAAGNATMDPVHHYYYDAENRIIQVDGAAGNCSTATACYVYDASGQRVRKTTGGTSVDYIYDLGGNVVAEVNSSGGLNRAEVFAGGRHLATYSNSTTYFTHADWLGTERARSSVAGAVCETTTSLPFGDFQSTNGNCGDPSPLHFTGKQRDPESGLDNFGARYDSSSMGRFMTPDAFYKDSHVGDPQSWNEYAYTRNNPLRYTDPNGETATVSTSCTTTNNQTTCDVNISASIAIYAAPGSGLTQAQLNGAASTIQNSIQNAWSGSFQQDGVTYNVSTQVSVQVTGSQAEATNSGAQNVIGLSNGPADAARGANAFTGPGTSLGNLIRGQDVGVWNYNTLGTNSLNTAAHEFTHLLGVDDKPGSVLSSTYPELEPSRATAQDLGWGVREVTSGVNSWVHEPQHRPMRYGEEWEKPSAYGNRTTVGAPLLGWWK